MNETVQKTGGSAGPVARLPRTSQRVIAIGTVLVVLTIALACFAIFMERRDDIRQSQANLATLGAVLGEQTSRYMHVVDLLLSDVEAHTQQTATTPATFSARLADEATNHFLVERLRGLPEANGIFLVDAGGKLVNFSRTWPIP